MNIIPGPWEILIIFIIVLVNGLPVAFFILGIRWIVKRLTESKSVPAHSDSVQTIRPIRILFMGSNPIDMNPLRLGAEIREIDDSLQSGKFRDRFELHQQWAVRVTDLQEHLMRYKPDVVHFSGHGTSASEIILEDATGKACPVPNQALSNLFSSLSGQIRCVILNACYSESQANAIAQSIDCVIGISDTIDDKTAIVFSRAFYQSLGYGHSVKHAFNSGIIQIALENLQDERQPILLALRTDPDMIDFVVEG